MNGVNSVTLAWSSPSFSQDSTFQAPTNDFAVEAVFNAAPVRMAGNDKNGCRLAGFRLWDLVVLLGLFPPIMRELELMVANGLTLTL